MRFCGKDLRKKRRRKRRLFRMHSVSATIAATAQRVLPAIITYVAADAVTAVTPVPRTAAIAGIAAARRNAEVLRRRVVPTIRRIRFAVPSARISRFAPVAAAPARTYRTAAASARTDKIVFITTAVAVTATVSAEKNRIQQTHNFCPLVNKSELPPLTYYAKARIAVLVHPCVFRFFLSARQFPRGIYTFNSLYICL